MFFEKWRELLNTCLELNTPLNKREAFLVFFTIIFVAAVLIFSLATIETPTI